MYTSSLTLIVKADSMVTLIRHGDIYGAGFRAGAVWRPSPAKRGALLHRALVEEASASADVLKAQTGQLPAAIAVFTLPQQR